MKSNTCWSIYTTMFMYVRICIYLISVVGAPVNFAILAFVIRKRPVRQPASYSSSVSRRYSNRASVIAKLQFVTV